MNLKFFVKKFPQTNILEKKIFLKNFNKQKFEHESKKIFQNDIYIYIYEKQIDGSKFSVISQNTCKEALTIDM